MSKDVDLAAALKKAKAKTKKDAWHFALVIKGTGEGTLIVNKGRVLQPDIDKAKKEIGATTVVKGRCSGDKDGLLFETAKEPDAKLAPTLKKVIKRDTGLTFNVDAKIGADVDDEDTPAPATPAATPPPPKVPATKDAVAKRLKTMEPWINDVLRQADRAPMPSDLPGTKEFRAQVTAKIRALLATVASSIDKGDFAAANKALDELEKSVNFAPLPDLHLPQACFMQGFMEGQRKGNPLSRDLIKPDEKECLKEYDRGYRKGWEEIGAIVVPERKPDKVVIQKGDTLVIEK